MLQQFVAQSSIAQSLTAGFAGMIASHTAPTHVVSGLNTSRQVVTVTPTAANDAVYTLVINGTSFVYTADGSATAAEIVAGLVSLVNAGTVPVTATNSTTFVTLTADYYTAADAFTYSSSSSAGALVSAQTIAQGEALADGVFVG